MMRLLTVTEAADHLAVPSTVGDPARWLRRHLQKRQDETGMALLVRVGDGSVRPTYRVDIDVVRQYCPELVSTTERLASALRGSAIVGRKALSDQKQALSDHGDVIDEIFDRISVMAASIRRIEMRLNKGKVIAR